tara:strand:+ start:374 stop:946 length:573 start_codon:yes stop_codon:yes gene_type:complete
MSYIRKCNECGQRISLREMPGGQWVAFDLGTDKPHEHFKKNKINSKDFLHQKKVKETYEVRSDIKNAIIRKQIMKISYLDKKGTVTEREIFPINVIQDGEIRKLSAYCTLRNSSRIFIVENILNTKLTGDVPDWFQDRLEISYLDEKSQNLKNEFNYDQDNFDDFFSTIGGMFKIFGIILLLTFIASFIF